MDCKTASSNSIGPGIRRVGCSGCVDIFGFSSADTVEVEEKVGAVEERLLKIDDGGDIDGR
jgi:hypothetical protein